MLPLNESPFSEFRDEEVPANLFVGFSKRSDGNMFRTNQNRLIPTANRKRYVEQFGIPWKDVMLIRPSHSANVSVLHEDLNDRWTTTTFKHVPRIDADYDGFYLGSDGLLAMAGSNHPVGLISGDCVPLVLWHAAGEFYGLLHVGLLGALNQMVRVLPRIIDWKRLRIADVYVCLGPTIDAADYKVSTSGLWNAIGDSAMRLPDIVDHVWGGQDGTYLNLRGLVGSQLLEVGFKASNIRQVSGSTASPDSEYFSHHAARDASLQSDDRMLTIVGRRDGKMIDR